MKKDMRIILAIILGLTLVLPGSVQAQQAPQYPGAQSKVDVCPVPTGSGLVQPTSMVAIAATTATTTTTMADTVNACFKGVTVITNQSTNTGAGSITPRIDGKDPATGQYFTLVTGTAIVSTGTTRMTVYPGVGTSTATVANDYLPAVWRIVVTANNATSTTYTVGATLLP